MAGRKKALESTVEGHLERRCQELDIFLLKNTGRNGIPDRLMVWDKTHWFLELKRPGERPTPLQEAVARKLREHGAVTVCADTKTRVDQVLDALTHRKPAPRELLYGDPYHPWDPERISGDMTGGNAHDI